MEISMLRFSAVAAAAWKSTTAVPVICVGTVVSTVRQHVRQWASKGQKKRTVCGDAEKGVMKL